jgi:hypothetical protein
MAKAISCFTPSTASGACDPELERILQPAKFFQHPRDVLMDEALGLVEKRAILSSWASDACAVESAPGLRQPPGLNEPVFFDDVMDALCELDRKEHRPSPPTRAAGAEARALLH